MFPFAKLKPSDDVRFEELYLELTKKKKCTLQLGFFILKLLLYTATVFYIQQSFDF